LIIIMCRVLPKGQDFPIQGVPGKKG